MSPEAATILVIVVATLLVQPFGEYAIDDDWGYVRSLQMLHRDGVLRILDLYQVSLIGHVLWGWIFTALLGFSFTVSKLSIVALFALECVTVIALLRHFGVRQPLIWIGVLTLIFDPLHFYHAFLFNTDVPAITWQLLAVLFYVRGVDEEDGSYRQATALALGSLFGGVAFLVRQPAILVHAAFFTYLALNDRRRLRSPWVLVHAFGPAVLVAVAFTYWYHAVHGPTRVFTYSQGELLQFFTAFDAAATARTLFFLVIYVGLFVFPASVVLVGERLRTDVRRWRAGGEPPVSRASAGILLGTLVAIGVMLAWVAAVDGQTFPYLRNKITRFGYLRPNEVILGERDVLWGDATSWVASVACALSFVAFVYLLLAAREPKRHPPRKGKAVRRERAGDPSTLVVIFLVIQAAYLLASARILFDRHLLVLCPAAVVVLCVAAERAAQRSADAGVSTRGFAAFVALLLPLAFYSVAGTHDVHAFSRTAFRAGEELMREGIPATRIDAGYAFDGWYVYDDDAHASLRPRLGSRDGWWVWNLFPSITTDYVVALSPTLDRARLAREITQPDRAVFLTPDLSAYRQVRSLAYRSYWPPGTKQVYVLARGTSAR